MRSITQDSWFLTLAVWVLGLNGSWLLAAEEAALPDSVKSALARFEHLKSLSMAWTRQYHQSAFGSATLGQPIPEKPSAPEVCYLAWQGGKMYKRRIEGGYEWKDDQKARRDEFAFDGRILAGGCPDQFSHGKPVRPGLTIDLAEDKKSEADYFGVKYFQPMGLHLPCGAGELLRNKHLASQVLIELENGGRLKTVEPARVDGRPLTRVAMLVDNPRWHFLKKMGRDAIRLPAFHSRSAVVASF